jgi:hypothetical protein
MLLDWSAQSLDLIGALAAKGDEQNLIFLKVYDVIQSAFQAYKVRCREPAQEDRVLTAKAEVFASAGDFAEALWMADIVGHQIGVHGIRRWSPRRLRITAR